MLVNDEMLKELEEETKKELQNKMLTPEKFSLAVEKYIRKHDYDPIDGLMEYCKQHNIELENVPSLVSSRLKSLLEEDAENRHLIKRKPKLKFA